MLDTIQSIGLTILILAALGLLAATWYIALAVAAIIVVYYTSTAIIATKRY